MTDIRELLRDATTDVVVDGDPVDRISRAARRHRQHTGFTAVVAIAVVVAAIVVPLSLRGSVAPSTQAAHKTRGLRAGIQYWARSDGPVAAGFGSIWAAGREANRPTWVDRLDRQTGKRITRVELPGPVTEVATGAGLVWTLGSIDAGQSAVSAIDPTTYAVHTWQITAVDGAPQGIAFADGSAWVTFRQRDQLWRLTPTANGISRTALKVTGGPADIASTGAGEVWVQRTVHGRHVLTRLVVSKTRTRLGQSVPWGGDIFSAGGKNLLWATAGPHTLVLLEPSNLGGCSACAQYDDILVAGPPIIAAISTSRGVFVSTATAQHPRQRTDFFAASALNSNGETPSATVFFSGSLAPDGDGVVISAGGQNALVHWVPAR
jgi:hypothetical protein